MMWWLGWSICGGGMIGGGMKVSLDNVGCGEGWVRKWCLLFGICIDTIHNYLLNKCPLYDRLLGNYATPRKH